MLLDGHFLPGPGHNSFFDCAQESANFWFHSKEAMCIDFWSGYDYQVKCECCVKGQSTSARVGDCVIDRWRDLLGKINQRTSHRSRRLLPRNAPCACKSPLNPGARNVLNNLLSLPVRHRPHTGTGFPSVRDHRTHGRGHRISGY